MNHTLLSILLVSACIFVALTIGTKPLAIGSKAPLFTTYDHQGKPFSLKTAIRQSSYVILCFYPKSTTTLCTAELCAIRDRQSSLPRGVTIVGISGGTADDHQAFATEYGIGFPLLIDTDTSIRKLYHAYNLWLIPARITYLINGNGIIIDRCTDMFAIDNHIALIESVKTLSKR